ncbi:MAG: hypothetical protein ABUT39_24865 [Acidobacteriota bacterium]
MIDPTPEITRLAAARLADLDADLPVAADRILAGNRPRTRGLDANTTLTLASFLLGLAQFGWAIFQEQRKKDDSRELLVRRLTMRIEQVDGEDLLPPGSRDRVVNVVVEEILSRAGADR